MRTDRPGSPKPVPTRKGKATTPGNFLGSDASRLVLYLDAAKYRHALDNQRLRRFRCIRLKVSGFVLVSAENSRPMHRHQPILRDNNFATTEHRAGLQHSLVAFHFRMPEINLVAAKHREQAAAFEVLGIDLPLAAPENVDRIK